MYVIVFECSSFTHYNTAINSDKLFYFGGYFRMNDMNNNQVPQQPEQPVQPPVQPQQPPVYQQPPQPMYIQAQPKPAGTGMAIASLVLGICSLIVPYVGIAVAIVGLIMGVLAKQKLSAVGAPSGMATAGIVTSIICLAFSVLIVAVCGSALCSLGSLGLYY